MRESTWAPTGAGSFAEDVRAGLTSRPKRLPSKYLYDGVGSRLFEAICELEWYRITRAEKALLCEHAAEVLASLEPPLTIVELGSGSGEKLGLLARGLPAERTARVHLVDISTTALAASELALAKDPRLSITTHAAAYEDGLRAAVAKRSGSGSLLVAFLGSNIGNFDPEEAAAFLRTLRASLRPGDALLLGADLVKPEPELLLAYDDPAGVTAAFDKNLLARINRELGGRFDLRAFSHEARWAPVDARIEMHLVSRRRQRVRIDAAGVDIAFDDGESIWTESSYKLTPERAVALGRSAGFACAMQWVDADAGFATTLLSVLG